MSTISRISEAPFCRLDQAHAMRGVPLSPVHIPPRRQSAVSSDGSRGSSATARSSWYYDSWWSVRELLWNAVAPSGIASTTTRSSFARSSCRSRRPMRTLILLHRPAGRPDRGP